MADVKRRLKVVFKNGRNKFLTGDNSLKRAMKEEEINYFNVIRTKVVVLFFFR